MWNLRKNILCFCNKLRIEKGDYYCYNLGVEFDKGFAFCSPTRLRSHYQQLRCVIDIAYFVQSEIIRAIPLQEVGSQPPPPRALLVFPFGETDRGLRPKPQYMSILHRCTIVIKLKPLSKRSEIKNNLSERRGNR